MTDLYDVSELHRMFTQKCLDKFSFLTAYGFEVKSTNEKWYGTEIVYKNQTTAIKVSFETLENNIFVYLIRLINGEIPAYIDAPSRWFYLDNIVKFRSPSTTLPRKGFMEQMTPEDIDHVLMEYAAALQEYAEDVLYGHFSVFTEIKRQMDLSRPLGNVEEVQPISSEEELVAQKQRLPAQLVEYYDTYFSELRSQLQSSDPLSQALPDFLKDYKRILSIGGRDGVVVAHFPIDIGITFSETDTGRILLRFPPLLDAEEDSYEFLQVPSSSVSDLVRFISGGEDVGIGNLPEDGGWGVRGFPIPQLKADDATGEITWQSPWTRLVITDLYSLRYWEDTERARLEAREDLNRDLWEHYTDALRSSIEAPIYKDADDVLRTSEAIGQDESRTDDKPVEIGASEVTDTYQREEFGQIPLPYPVDDLRFSTFKQAA